MLASHRALRLSLGLAIVLGIAGIVTTTYTTTWQRSGTWWRAGLGEGMTTHTIDFRLDGTVIVRDLDGSCGDNGPVYAHVGTHHRTYRWQAPHTLVLTIDGQSATYTVIEDEWILRIKHLSQDRYAGDYLRGGPGVRPCLT